MMGDLRTAAALLRFHLRAGVRLSLRAAVPLAAALTAGVGLSPSPADAVDLLAARLARGRLDPPAAAAVLALCFGIAAWAAPRLTYGLSGWLRHLPAASGAHRRAAACALAAAQAPLLGAGALLILGAGISGKGDVSAAGAASIPIAVLGSAYAALPVRRRWAAAPAAASAAVLGLIGGGPAQVVALLLVAGADAASGPLVPPGRRRPAGAPRGVPQGARLALRAMGWRAAASYAWAAIPLGACALFVHNNPAAGPGAAAAAVRLGGAAAVGLQLAALAQLLAVRRPPWPWARSLPGSAAARVAADAALLGGLAAPAVLATAILDPWSAPVLLGILPSLAIAAAGAARSGAAARTGPAGRVAALGAGAALLVALLPWGAALALAAIPVALRAAAETDRRRKVTRFAGAHHLARGDTLSWEGR